MASPDVNDIELMRDEAGGLLYETSIATITFFRGDMVAASQALRAQFDEVARANPWLVGRLVRDKTSKGKLVLRHPVAPTEAHIDAIFASDHAEDASGELSLGVPYPKLCEALFAKKGKRQGFAAWVLLFYALWHNHHVLGADASADVREVLEMGRKAA